MYLRTVSIKLFLTSIFVIVLSIFGGCDPTVHCPRGVYIDFSDIDLMQGINYSVSRDELAIWLTTKQLNKEGRECLPKDISVQNLSAPKECNITVLPPTYVKGRPLMALYVKNVSQIRRNELIEFDLFQKNIKKQKVCISVDFENASYVAVIINGKRIAADRAR